MEGHAWAAGGLLSGSCGAGDSSAGPRGFCQPVLPGRAGVHFQDWAAPGRDSGSLALADEGTTCDIMTQTLPILTPGVGGKPERAANWPTEGQIFVLVLPLQTAQPPLSVNYNLLRERSQQEEEGQD